MTTSPEPLWIPIFLNNQYIYNYDARWCRQGTQRVGQVLYTGVLVWQEDVSYVSNLNHWAMEVCDKHWIGELPTWERPVVDLSVLIQDWEEG